MAKRIKRAFLVLLIGAIVMGILATPSAGSVTGDFPIKEGYALPGELIDARLIINVTEPMGAVHFRIDYDPSVCNMTSVAQDGFDVLVANTQGASEGWIEFICYQTGAAGAGNTTFTFSIKAVGDYCR